jgi:hypothetical protein
VGLFHLRFRFGFNLAPGCVCKMGVRYFVRQAKLARSSRFESHAGKA